MVAAVKFEKKQQVAKISFSNAPHNAINREMQDNLIEAFHTADQDPEVKVIILQSHGDRTFCAGASFNELLACKNLIDASAFFSGFGQIIHTMTHLSKMVIVIVQGKTVGGGLGLIAAADYAIASMWASVRLSELSIGIGPFVIEPAISHKIGKGHFQKLAFNPKEWQSAEWGKQVGFFHEVFPTNEQAREYAEYLSKELTSMNLNAVAALKKAVWDIAGFENKMMERAAISASLLLDPGTQQTLKRIKKA